MKTQRFTQTHTGVQTQYMYTHTHRYTDSLNEPSEAADLSITLAYCTTCSYVASSRLAVLGCHNHCRQHTCPCGIPSSAWLSPCSCGCCIHWFSGTPCIVTWRSCTHLVAHEDTDILYRITQYSCSPTQYSRSPTQYSRSPTQYSRSPTQYSRSPTQYSRSPTQYSHRLSYTLAYGSPHTCVALTSPYLHTIKTVHTEIKSGIKHAYHHDQAESSPCQVALP